MHNFLSQETQTHQNNGGRTQPQPGKKKHNKTSSPRPLPLLSLGTQSPPKANDCSSISYTNTRTSRQTIEKLEVRLRHLEQRQWTPPKPTRRQPSEYINSDIPSNSNKTQSSDQHLQRKQIQEHNQYDAFHHHERTTDNGN